jgi:hypothetical protein
MISMNTLRIRDLFRSDIDPCFALSSSGRKLAYVKEVDGVAQICIAGIDDLTNCVPITKSSRPVFAAPYEPIRWVCGESHIIFTRLEETTFVRYLVNVNSGEEVLIPVVSRKLWKFSGVALRAFEGLFFQAARSRGIGSIG